MSFGKLNEEEKKIAHLILQGYTAPTIADHYGYSTAVVLAHIDNIVRKLGPRKHVETIRSIDGYKKGLQ